MVRVRVHEGVGLGPPIYVNPILSFRQGGGGPSVCRCEAGLRCSQLLSTTTVHTGKGLEETNADDVHSFILGLQIAHSRSYLYTSGPSVGIIWPF